MAHQLSIFGMGYVGCVTAACLAQEGHRVIGVDVNPVKIALLRAGKSPIVEAGIADLIKSVTESQALCATSDAAYAVKHSDLSLICVGTPTRSNGALDISFVVRVCEEIGAVLATKSESHTVVVRSTVLPGTVESHLIPALERTSGKRAGVGFEICVNPEFLRESTSIQDFRNPPFTLIGGQSDAATETVSRLYSGVDAPVYRTDVKTAEMVKYVCNCFHGLKVGFANEVGSLSKALGMDSHRVMEIFCQDTKLNLSPYYLKPGFAFGGSCLPKDIRATVQLARANDLETPILSAILPSNDLQIRAVADRILAKGNRKIGVLGLSFKAGTDDLRESPIVTLLEILIGRGMELAVYDREVSQAHLIGANREYIEREIPHIWSLVKPTVAGVIDFAETIVVGQAHPDFTAALEATRSDQVVVDLARVSVGGAAEYDGICW